MNEELDFIIPEATPADIEVLVEFRCQLQDFITELNPNLFGLTAGWEEKKRDQYTGIIDDPKKHLILACSGAGIPIGIGLASIVEHPDFVPPQFGYVDDLWVAPEFRRSGVGGRIVESLLKFFEDQGIDHITLNYVVGNPEAERFWKKLGFNPVVVAANRSPKT